jgi:hypothetical protein
VLPVRWCWACDIGQPLSGWASREHLPCTSLLQRVPMGWVRLAGVMALTGRGIFSRVRAIASLA